MTQKVLALLCVIFALAFAKCGHAQYIIEVQVLPSEEVSSIAPLSESDIFQIETIKESTKVYSIESNSLDALVSLLRETPEMGLLKTQFSLVKFPEIAEELKNYHYDVRKLEYKSANDQSAEE